jgi:hypothetical protein
MRELGIKNMFRIKIVSKKTKYDKKLEHRFFKKQDFQLHIQAAFVICGDYGPIFWIDNPFQIHHKYVIVNPNPDSFFKMD